MTSNEPAPVSVLGLPLTPYTYVETLDRIDRLLAAREPSFFITANLNYAMLVDSDDRLKSLNERAAFIVADGMPLVWWSRLGERSLPERVAGSDLIYGMCERAAVNGRSIYLFGASPGVAEQAAKKLVERYRGLKVVGVESPPFRPVSEAEEREQIERIKSARPDILFVSFSQPKGDIWIDRNFERLGVPLCVQVGASLDFVAGRAKRSPRWMQKLGLEWLYRLAKEPRRLFGRYRSNLCFLLSAIFAARFRRERRGQLFVALDSEPKA